MPTFGFGPLDAATDTGVMHPIRDAFARANRPSPSLFSFASKELQVEGRVRRSVRNAAYERGRTA